MESRAQTPGVGKTIWFLDFLRWFSAGMVVLTHARDSLITDYEGGSLLLKAFYFVTGFGHEAVMIFFVVSGYLVGGGLWLRCLKGTSLSRALPEYFIHRFSRIYIVLIPALLLTAIFDGLGRSLPSADDIYVEAGWSHTLLFSSAARSNLVNFLSTFANLQNWMYPPFGTNIPLWSLSYEWFYYVTFPLFLFAVLPLIRGRTANVHGFAAALLAVAVYAGALTLDDPLQKFVLYYPIWLAGVAARLLAQQIQPWRIITPIAILATFAALVAERTDQVSITTGDITIGIALAVVMTDNRTHRIAGWCPRLNQMLAGFSYSLYATHFPIIVLLVAVMHATGFVSQRLPFDFGASILMAILVAMPYAAAWGFSKATEQQTERLRHWIAGRFGLTREHK